MSYADEVFKKMCRDVIENGTDTRGQAVRPHWDDGSSAYTIKRFGIVNRYDLRKEFPAITLRPVAIKSATDEILWIWQQKSNNIKDLHSHIWDAWADENGSIGKAYGYQMSKKYLWSDITPEGLEKVYGPGWQDMVMHISKDPGYDAKRKGHIIVDDSPNASMMGKKSGKPLFYMDQVDKVLYDLKTQPFSRRIMTNIYDFSDLSEMNLYPCAYSCTFNVTEEDGKLVLNMILNQRSQDILAANAWNVCQYAVLLCMIARDVGMIPGEFVHVIADCHIYDRHVEIIKELISRPEHPAPRLWLNPEKHDFYSFTREDVKLLDYEHGEQVKDIPVAV